MADALKEAVERATNNLDRYAKFIDRQMWKWADQEAKKARRDEILAADHITFSFADIRTILAELSRLEGLKADFIATGQAAATHLKRALDAEARERVLLDLINSPEVEDFMRGVPLEAAHQVERFGADHDAGKEPLDWFWLIGYLAQKAATSAMSGDVAKAKHHTISTAAALANWHRALSGGDNRMRPGIDPADRALTLETPHAE